MRARAYKNCERNARSQKNDKYLVTPYGAANNSQQTQRRDGVQESDGGKSNDAVSACDSPKDDQGSVGILEGFGTLDLNTEGSVNVNEELLLLASEDGLDTTKTVIAQDEAAVQSVEEFSQPEEQIIKPGFETDERVVLYSDETLENTNNKSSVNVDDILDENNYDVEGTKAEGDKLLSFLQQAKKAAKGEQTDEEQSSQNDEAKSTDFTAVVKEADKTAVRQSVNELEGTGNEGDVTRSDMQENIANLIESIEARIAEDTQEYQLALKPAHLGKLTIKLIMNDEGIKAEIKTAEMAAKGLIENELFALEEALKTRGIEVKQIDVAYEAAAFEFNNQKDANTSAEQFLNGRQNRLTVLQTIQEPESYANYFEAQGTAALYSEVSSVEFRA